MFGEIAGVGLHRAKSKKGQMRKYLAFSHSYGIISVNYSGLLAREGIVKVCGSTSVAHVHNGFFKDSLPNQGVRLPFFMFPRLFLRSDLFPYGQFQS